MIRQGKKVKVFVWGLVNWNWSLDINAANMVAALDKDKFKVYTMVTTRLPFKRVPGVTYFKRHYPDRLWFFVSLLRGMMICDVAMVYRMGEFKKYSWMPSFFGVKTMSVLGLVSDIFMSEFHKIDSLHALSEHMKKHCKELGIPVKERILYNPINTGPFEGIRQVKSSLKNVIFIGHDFERKGFDDLVFLAKRCPELQFHIVGGYENQLNLARQMLGKESLNQRFILYGPLDRENLLQVMGSCQLHVLPSRNEGRPKGAIEAAAAGLPSILYFGYGAEEYITNGKNGYIVSTRDELPGIVTKLLDSPALLQSLSENTSQISEQFHLKEIVKSYESLIEKLVFEKGES